jgi:hypothetical protein
MYISELTPVPLLEANRGLKLSHNNSRKTTICIFIVYGSDEFRGRNELLADGLNEKLKSKSRRAYPVQQQERQYNTRLDGSIS